MSRKVFKEITKEGLYNTIAFEYKKIVEGDGYQLKVSENLFKGLHDVVDAMTEDNNKWCLFVYGQIGNGKSTLSRAIQEVFNFRLINNFYFNIGEIYNGQYMSRISAIRLVESFLDEREKYKELRSASWLIVDDIGSEAPLVNMYGTVFKPMIDLLFYRYDNRLPTIFISNFRLKGDGTEENKGLFDIYRDPRFEDRFKQMFNRVLIKGKSYR